MLFISLIYTFIRQYYDNYDVLNAFYPTIVLSSTSIEKYSRFGVFITNDKTNIRKIKGFPDPSIVVINCG